MKITVLTLFPKMFDNFLDESIIKRAIKDKKIQIEIINFREYSKEKKQAVDEYQYGGGAGMVLMLQPIVDAIRNHKTEDTKVILLSPQGPTYNQLKAKELSKHKHIILIAGHYEGFDERINNYVDETISIGDYVLTGGEIPAMVIIDSVARLVDNVISNKSLKDETFEKNLLDYPVYTKPIDFEGHIVPDVLLSGNHQKINQFRKEQQIIKTKLNRKDLYKKYLMEEKNNGFTKNKQR